jgi:hypothetical protein
MSFLEGDFAMNPIRTRTTDFATMLAFLGAI